MQSTKRRINHTFFSSLTAQQSHTLRTPEQTKEKFITALKRLIKEPRYPEAICPDNAKTNRCSKF